MNSLLHRIAAIFAWLGGVAACIVAGMTVTSIAMRALVSAPVQGDVELTQFGIALSISLCLPWCQQNKANIIVDFFTQGLSRHKIRWLDAAGRLLLASMCLLLAWRTGIGAVAVCEGERDLDDPRLAHVVGLRVARARTRVDGGDRAFAGRGHDSGRCREGRGCLKWTR